MVHTHIVIASRRNLLETRHDTLVDALACVRPVVHRYSAAYTRHFIVVMNDADMIGGPDPEVMEAINKGNAVVFLDVSLGEGENTAFLGRIKLELFVRDVCIPVRMRTSFCFIKSFTTKLTFQFLS
jgi:hypothetical protein